MNGNAVRWLEWLEVAKIGMLKIAGNGWKWPKWWEWLDVNGWKLLLWLGIAKNGWNLLDMDGNGLKTVNDQKLFYITWIEMSHHGLK